MNQDLTAPFLVATIQKMNPSLVTDVLQTPDLLLLLLMIAVGAHRLLLKIVPLVLLLMSARQLLFIELHLLIFVHRPIQLLTPVLMLLILGLPLLQNHPEDFHHPLVVYLLSTTDMPGLYQLTIVVGHCLQMTGVLVHLLLLPLDWRTPRQVDRLLMNVAMGACRLRPYHPQKTEILDRWKND